VNWTEEKLRLHKDKRDLFDYEGAVVVLSDFEEVQTEVISIVTGKPETKNLWAVEFSYLDESGNPKGSTTKYIRNWKDLQKHGIQRK